MLTHRCSIQHPLIRSSPGRHDNEPNPVRRVRQELQLGPVRQLSHFTSRGVLRNARLEVLHHLIDLNLERVHSTTCPDSKETVEVAIKPGSGSGNPSWARTWKVTLKVIVLSDILNNEYQGDTGRGTRTETYVVCCCVLGEC